MCSVITERNENVDLSNFLNSNVHKIGEQTSYDIENGKLYKLQIWQAIKTIYERSETGRVNDPRLVRFPWQLIYIKVFSAKFC